jgi:hypothetical protein
MATDKLMGLSVEQQRLTDRIRIYGKPIGNEAVAEILEAVGAEHVPSDINVEQLEADIYIAWRSYNGLKRYTSKAKRRRLIIYAEKVSRAVYDLKKILDQESWEADIFRYNMSFEMFPLNMFRIRLQSFPITVSAFESLYRRGAATPRTQGPRGFTATKWLFGWSLPETFKKHFKQEANRNRQMREAVDSPYIRFAIACAKVLGMKRLSPETVSTYMTDAQKHFGNATKENAPNISEWHLDGQGNLTRTLENF